MRKKKKVYAILVVLFSLVLFGLYYVVFIYPYRSYTNVETIQFIDLNSSSSVEYTETEKNNIKDYLDKCYYEDDYYAGFSSNQKNDDLVRAFYLNEMIYNLGLEKFNKDSLERIITRGVEGLNPLEIARIFEPNYQNLKFNNFVKTLTEEELNKCDIQAMFNIFSNANLENDSSILDRTKKVISNKFNTIEEANKIDCEATCYGYLLSDKIGYEINKVKLLNFINYNYARLSETKDINIIAYILYYNTMLDRLFCIGEKPFTGSIDLHIQKKELDKYISIVIDNMKSDYTLNCIDLSFKVSSVISDLKIFKIDLKLNYNQIKKIKKVLKTFVKSTQNEYSYYSLEVYHTNKVLNLEILSDDYLMDNYNNLYVNGGIDLFIGENNPNCIATTNFRQALGLHGIILNSEEILEFAKSLKHIDGIYYEELNSKSISLKSIYLGGILNKGLKRSEGNDKTFY